MSTNTCLLYYFIAEKRFHRVVLFHLSELCEIDKARFKKFSINWKTIEIFIGLKEGQMVPSILFHFFKPQRLGSPLQRHQ